MPGPDPAFWQQRFESGDTPWDRRGPSPRLIRWLDEGALKPCRIAVPGCGSGWEAVELARRGFEVTAIDCTEAACAIVRRHAEAAGVQLHVLHADVTAWNPSQPLDAIYEQTCLCAIHPTLWRGYADSLWAWLRPGGRLAALFMQRPRESAVREGLVEGPPYHGDINAMHALFPDARWAWPKPPLDCVPHPAGWHELAALLERRG